MVGAVGQRRRPAAPRVLAAQAQVGGAELQARDGAQNAVPDIEYDLGRGGQAHRRRAHQFRGRVDHDGRGQRRGAGGRLGQEQDPAAAPHAPPPQRARAHAAHEGAREHAYFVVHASAHHLEGEQKDERQRHAPSSRASDGHQDGRGRPPPQAQHRQAGNQRPRRDMRRREAEDRVEKLGERAAGLARGDDQAAQKKRGPGVALRRRGRETAGQARVGARQHLRPEGIARGEERIPEVLRRDAAVSETPRQQVRIPRRRPRRRGCEEPQPAARRDDDLGEHRPQRRQARRRIGRRVLLEVDSGLDAQGEHALRGAYALDLLEELPRVEAVQGRRRRLRRRQQDQIDAPGGQSAEQAARIVTVHPNGGRGQRGFLAGVQERREHPGQGRVEGRQVQLGRPVLEQLPHHAGRASDENDPFDPRRLARRDVDLGLVGEGIGKGEGELAVEVHLALVRPL